MCGAQVLGANLWGIKTSTVTLNYILQTKCEAETHNSQV